MSKQAADIIEDFINSISLEVQVLSSSDDGEQTTLELSEVYHLRAYMTLTVYALGYQVVSVTGTTVIVEGVIASPTLAVIPNPFFFHGTPQATNVLLGDINDFKQKSPLIYLYEKLRDEKIADPESLTARRVTVALFVLDNSLAEWTTDEHYTEIINRLASYVGVLEDNIQEYPLFNAEEIDVFTRTPHANFGQFMDNKGYVNHIFDEVYSGIELRFTLPIKANLGC